MNYDTLDGLEPKEKVDGGYLTGFLGALFGALLGALPWFAASTFAHFYIGWLAFLIGWASLGGYKLLHGTKKTPYATAVIFICSILAIILADLASNLYSLMTDPSIISRAERYGDTPLELALNRMSYIETLTAMLPNLGMGLLIGVLGIFSARPQILLYTDPSKAKLNMAPAAVPAGDAALFAVPDAFTVRERKSVLVVGIICTSLFAVFFLLSILLAVGDGDLEMLLIGLLFIPFILLGLYCIMDYVNRRLSVSRNGLAYSNWLGRSKEFRMGDIAFVTMPIASRICLHGQDGKVICKLENNMANYPMLVQYISKNGIGLRA